MKKLFLIIGAPGSGKTTDASIISQNNRNIAHYSTGNLLRKEAASGSELGKTIKQIIDAGKIVPVKIALDAIINVINNTKEEIILIDGYPRSQEQMLGLDEALKNQNEIMLSAVIDVEVSDATAKSRVLDRNRGVDDDEKIFENRLELYHGPKKDIDDFYKGKNLLYKIDGENSIEDIVRKMESIIHSFY